MTPRNETSFYISQLSAQKLEPNFSTLKAKQQDTLGNILDLAKDIILDF